MAPPHLHQPTICPSSYHYQPIPSSPSLPSMSWSWQLRILTVFFLLNNFLLTCGVVYGWSGLLRLLKSEGQFSDSSCTSPTQPCTSQDNQLNTIATVAFNLANAATVVHGFTLDWYGVRSNAVFGGFLFTIGMLLLSVSSSASFNAFIPAYAMMAWGGVAAFLSSFQFANLYDKPNLWRSIVNALFTAAGLIFTVINWLHEAHIDRATVLGAYSCVAAALTLGMIALYPTHAYDKGDECSLPIVEWYTGYTPLKKQKGEAASEQNGTHTATTGTANGQIADDEKKPLHDDEPNEFSTATAHAEAAGLQEEDLHSTALDYSYKEPIKEAPSHSSTASDDSSLTYSQLMEREKQRRKDTATLWSEVKDPQTILLSLFFSFGLLFSNWFVATITTQLSAMGDNGNYAIAFIFLSSFIPIPIAALIGHWIRTIRYSGLTFICAISLCTSYLPLYSSDLWIQPLAFLLYTLARAIVVTTLFTYVALHYRSDHYGRMIAVVTVVAIPIGFLQLLMQQMTEKFTYRDINTLCILAFTPCFIYAWWLKRKGL